MWVGGKCEDDFVRIVVDHIARQMDEQLIRDTCMEMIEKRLAPHIKERGFRWEVHVDETPTDLWRVQGIKPPPEHSEAEQEWAKNNAAAEYEMSEAAAAALRAARDLIASVDNDGPADQDPVRAIKQATAAAARR